MSKLTKAQNEMLNRAVLAHGNPESNSAIVATGQSLRTASALSRLGLLEEVGHEWIKRGTFSYFHVSYVATAVAVQEIGESPETVDAPIAQLWVCADCMIGNVNEGEHLYYKMNGSTFDAVTSPNFDVNEDGENDEESGVKTFSSAACEGCGSPLAGDRYRFAVWAWL